MKLTFKKNLTELESTFNLLQGDSESGPDDVVQGWYDETLEAIYNYEDEIDSNLYVRLGMDENSIEDVQILEDEELTGDAEEQETEELTTITSSSRLSNSFLSIDKLNNSFKTIFGLLPWQSINSPILSRSASLPATLTLKVFGFPFTFAKNITFSMAGISIALDLVFPSSVLRKCEEDFEFSISFLV